MARTLKPVTTCFAAAGVLLAAVCSLSWIGRAQTVPDGKALFAKRCGGCHALDRELEGPRLAGVYGRAAGSVATFTYSEALKNSKVTWSAATLDTWLTDTESLVPGNDMTFRVLDPQERRAIIDYLKVSSPK